MIAGDSFLSYDPQWLITKSQFQSMKNEAKNLNLKLQSRGMSKVSFLSTSLHNPTNENVKNDITDNINSRSLYECDHNVMNIINSLLRELDLSHDQLMTQELIIKEREKDNSLLKAKVNQNISNAVENQKKVIDLEMKVVRLELQATELNDRKTAIDNELREIKSKFNLAKDCNTVEKRNALKENNNIIERIIFKNPKENTKRDHLYITKAKAIGGESKNRYRTNLLAQNNLLNGFLQNTYNCLSHLRETHGLASIASTFIPNKQQLAENQSKQISLSDLDAKLVNLIRNIQHEPLVGMDDTFKFHKIGVERQKEISHLKKEIEIIKKSYDRAINELNSLKQNHNILL